MERTEFILDCKTPTTTRQLSIMFKDDHLRLRIYQYMLNELKKRLDNKQPIGLCHCCPAFIGNVSDDLISYRLSILPELWSKKPRDFNAKHNSYWFDERDYTSRFNLLTKVVNELTIKLNK